MLHEKINEIEMYAIMEIIVKYSYPCSKQYSSKLINKKLQLIKFPFKFRFTLYLLPQQAFPIWTPACPT